MAESIAKKKKERSKNGTNGGLGHTDKTEKNTKMKMHRPLLGLLSTSLFFILSILVSVLFAFIVIEVNNRKENKGVLSAELEEVLFPQIKLYKTNGLDIIKEPVKAADEVTQKIEAETDSSVDASKHDVNKNTKTSSKQSQEANSNLIKKSKEKSSDNKKVQDPSSQSQSKVDIDDKTVHETLDRPVAIHDEEQEDSTNSSQIDTEPKEDANGQNMLKDLYLEVESLADNILSRDPKNELLKVLSPHLENVLKDMENGKYSGVEDALRHAKGTLEAVKESLSRDAVSGDTLSSISDDTIDEIKKVLEPKTHPEEFEKEDKPLPVKNGDVSDGEKEPVDEVIPEPIHITPLGYTKSKKEMETTTKISDDLPLKNQQSLKIDTNESEKDEVTKPEMKDNVKVSTQKNITSEKMKAGKKADKSESSVQNSKTNDASTLNNDAEVKNKQVEKETIGTEIDNKELSTQEKSLNLQKKQTPGPNGEENKGIVAETVAKKKDDSQSIQDKASAGSSKTASENSKQTTPTTNSVNGEKQENAQKTSSKLAESSRAKSKAEKQATSSIASGHSKNSKKDRDKLKDARNLLPKNPHGALKIYDALLKEKPDSFDALYGRAQALDLLAEQEKSNTWLEQAIEAYILLLDLADKQPSIDDSTYRTIGLTCATRMAFRGWQNKSIRVLQRLAQWFPDDVLIHNKLGVAFLLLNQPKAAFEIFKGILESHPHDGFAQVHYGFILKTTFDNNTEGVKFLRKGIQTGDEGTSDGRFYFHLGDGLQRLGKNEEAYSVYDEGVEKGLFMSRYQRSLYNVKRLTSRPLWTHEQTTYTQFFSKLESHWKEIRDEALSLLTKNMTQGFVPETENLRDTGDWQQFDIFSRGKKISKNCEKVPKTCSLVDKFTSASSCKRGQVKFSLMQPGTHVWSHTGPTNCRLRAHLGLVVPAGLKMRVAKDFITWEEGKIFIFDDSFEHEVWHEGSSPRLVLIVDVWHPELSDSERRSLSPI